MPLTHDHYTDLIVHLVIATHAVGAVMGCLMVKAAAASVEG